MPTPTQATPIICSAAELEAKVAELDGYTAEARASELLLGVEIEQRLHDGPMANVAPGYKLRVLLAQALFADPDILLLDEPTNHLDINTIRWLEGVLNARSSTMVVISHDRHFLNSVCTHMADLDYRTLSVYPGNYDDYMIASTQARERLLSQNSQGEGPDRRARGIRAPVSRQQIQGAPGDLARQGDREDQDRGRQAVEPAEPIHPLRDRREGQAAPEGGGDRAARQGFRSAAVLGSFLAARGGQAPGDHRRQRVRQDDAAAHAARRARAGPGTVKWAEKATVGYYPQDQSAEFESEIAVFDWMKQWAREGDDDQVVRSVLGQAPFLRR